MGKFWHVCNLLSPKLRWSRLKFLKFTWSTKFVFKKTWGVANRCLSPRRYTTKHSQKYQKAEFNRIQVQNFIVHSLVYVFCNRILLVQLQSMRIKQQFISQLFKNLVNKPKVAVVVPAEKGFFSEKRDWSLKIQGMQNVSCCSIWYISSLCQSRILLWVNFIFDPFFYSGCEKDLFPLFILSF